MTHPCLAFAEDFAEFDPTQYEAEASRLDAAEKKSEIKEEEVKPLILRSGAIERIKSQELHYVDAAGKPFCIKFVDNTSREESLTDGDMIHAALYAPEDPQPDNPVATFKVIAGTRRLKPNKRQKIARSSVDGDNHNVLKAYLTVASVYADALVRFGLEINKRFAETFMSKLSDVAVIYTSAECGDFDDRFRMEYFYRFPWDCAFFDRVFPTFNAGPADMTLKLKLVTSMRSLYKRD